MAKKNDAKAALQNTKSTTIQDLIKKSTVELGKALPAHMSAERLVRISLTTLRLNPKLYQCDPMSFLGALFQSAGLGLEPNIEGQCYIIPFGNQAQFMIGFKGYVELFYRHESSIGLQWGKICDNDSFEFDKGKNYLSHTYNLKKDRGEPYAYWVKAFMKDGASSFEVMSKKECEKHGKQHSKTYNNGPWKTDFDSMALKTVLIRLMKILPKSIELKRAVLMDETVKTRIDPDMFTVPDETDWDSDESKKVETEAVDESPVSDEQPEPPKRGRPKKEPVETEVSGLNDDTPPLDDEDEAIANKKRIHEKMVDEGFFDNEEAE